MKKVLATIVLCIIFVTSLTVVNAADLEAAGGFTIAFNGETTDYTSVVSNNTHYVPMRKVFEKMGAVVFYRNRDNRILALSRDGDVIIHSVGSNTITVNGNEKAFDNASFFEEYVTYIPIDMMAFALCPDGIFYENQQLNIQKQIFNNEYHKGIADVLKLHQNTNFFPERFKRYMSCHLNNPGYSMEDVISVVNFGIDYPFYVNISTIENPYDVLVLVNKYNQLPAQFNQNNLVNMDKKYTLSDGKQYWLAAVAYEKYVQMWEDAKKEGLSMMVVSAYRTEDYQRNLYNKRLRAYGIVYADNYSARAGHSEHQTGLAIDIGSTKTSFEYTNEFKWLQEHAHEYGFIMRYPKGKTWITGYEYEPWHYRFVGVDAATKIFEEGITFEEYYAKYIDVSEYR